jgi:hypothetical protein
MSEPRELLAIYADETDFERGDLLDDREHEAPAAFAALRAVLDLHKPEPLDDIDPECSCCRTDEHNASGWPSAVRVPWPCPTVQAIATALEAK